MASETSVCRVGFAHLSPIFVWVEPRDEVAVMGLATSVWMEGSVPHLRIFAFVEPRELEAAMDSATSVWRFELG
jgi:hypothetical protein